jgi:glyoxylase-like metal-dependent hydrolase (beta-lactamase superfamily II)
MRDMGEEALRITLNKRDTGAVSGYFFKMVRKWVVGPFQCNCRLIACPKTGEAALVDPGDEAETILKGIQGLKLPNGNPVQVKWLLHTHGHLDHIGATRDVKQALDLEAAQPNAKTQIAIHRADEPIYRALKMQGQLFGMDFEEPLPIDHFLEHEEVLRIGEIRLSIIHTPGHSPGSVSMRLHEDAGLKLSETVLTGDTLFQGSVGRTDLWGADQDQMFRSIRERLLTLDGDTLVCPGHGPDSSIAIEKRENPFL